MAKEPVVLEGRYALTEVVRRGGMSVVTKAVDLPTGKFVAVKQMIPGGDERRSKESLMREAQALGQLTHPNIVQFITAGRDSGGRDYIVMEWLEENLEQAMERTGPISWSDCYSRVARPLLEAVRIAQRNKWVHRDIKPKNILLASGDVPKIADYGISKHIIDEDPWVPVQGHTFRQHRTPGFSPAETDESNPYAYDCFSIAAVIVYCLTGHSIKIDEDTYRALDEAPLPSQVKPIVERALSRDPAERFPMASTMLAELDRADEELTRTQQAVRKCHLGIVRKAENRLCGILNLDRDKVKDFVLGELRGPVGITFRDLPERDSSPPLQARLDLVGQSWRFEVIVAGIEQNRIEITDAFEVGPGFAADRKKRLYKPNLAFSFEKPGSPERAGLDLQELLEEIRTNDLFEKRNREQEESERVFRLWKEFLRDRAEIIAGRENAIQFVDRRIEGNNAILDADVSPSEDIVGQERIIEVGKNRIYGIVQDVSLSRISFYVQNGDIRQIPRRGQLLRNMLKDQRAVEKQAAALDSVIFERAANASLKRILAQPKTARPPIPVEDITPSKEYLDDEKRVLLGRALGVVDALAIEGPPGTGKTELITEIVIQYLARHPQHRILLSSQTHTALDNVLKGVNAAKQLFNVVRVGREDQAKISAVGQAYLLSRKLDEWANGVRAAAEQNFSDWAVAHGLDRHAIKVGMLVERLAQLLTRSQALSDQLARNESQQIELQTRSQTAVGTDLAELNQDTVETDDRSAELNRELAQTKRTESEVRRQLEQLDEYGKGLAASSDISELNDWQSYLIKDDPNTKTCVSRLRLLEEWLLRVGRSSEFQAAVISSAQIVAGTCVGVAAVRGIEEIGFDLVIVDEASKATVTEILVPLSLGKKWIVVGDPKQLPPFFEEFGQRLKERFEEQEIRQTILDRFLLPNIGLPPECRGELSNQYRMVKAIGDLVSECFYEGRLNSPMQSHGLDVVPAVPSPVTWYTTARGKDRFEKRIGSSYLNDVEISVIRDVLRRLNFVAHGQRRSIEVAVIAGYGRQAEALDQMIARHKVDWSDLTVVCNTVDAFQGMQADICIYSVTRSNSQKNLGFLKEKPRLNVALSRGKSGLIIVGDHIFCRKAYGQNPFRTVIEYVEGHPSTCALVESP